MRIKEQVRDEIKSRFVQALDRQGHADGIDLPNLNGLELRAGMLLQAAGKPSLCFHLVLWLI